MSKPFNRLSPEQAERLALLSEECGEVVQAIGKILRHGYRSRHPNGGPTNMETLEDEVGDLVAAVRLLTKSGDLRSDEITDATASKLERVGRYLHHAKSEPSP